MIEVRDFLIVFVLGVWILAPILSIFFGDSLKIEASERFDEYAKKQNLQPIVCLSDSGENLFSIEKIQCDAKTADGEFESFKAIRSGEGLHFLRIP